MKAIYGVFDSPKKRTKKQKIILTVLHMIPQVDFFLFVFWVNRGHHKLLPRLTDYVDIYLKLLFLIKSGYHFVPSLSTTLIQTKVQI